MLPTDSEVLLTFGLLLAVALVLGRVAILLRLPQVTAYLLAGVLFGPSLFNLAPKQHIAPLEPLAELAVAVVLFHLGSQFPLARAKRILGHVAWLSVGELVATLLTVSLGLWLLGQHWQIALLLGTLALATAPATTILVFKETESEGTITDYSQALVAINNLAAIVVFELVFVAVDVTRDRLGPTAAEQLKALVRDLAGSTILGVAAGLAVSYCFGLVSQRHRIVFLVAVTAAMVGLCNSLGASYMLTFLTMGIVTANTCYVTRHIQAEFDRLTGLLCIIFFVVSGMELEIGALFTMGLVGAAYVVLRCAGKYFGVFLAAIRIEEKPVVCRWLGATLVSQAGAAIALSAIAVERDPELGRYLQTIILGTVPFFEIVGPILIRQAVIRADEVPLAYAVPHVGGDLLEQLRIVWNRAALAFGFDPWRRHLTANLTVQAIMRKNVHALSESFTFDEVLAFIEHSRDNTYPVVDRNGELTGMIRYRELSKALVDHSLGPLVRAADLATSTGKVLYPDDPVQRARQLFHTSKDDCLPVVAREEPHLLLGIVRRRDILRLLIRRQSGSGEAVG